MIAAICSYTMIIKLHFAFAHSSITIKWLRHNAEYFIILGAGNGFDKCLLPMHFFSTIERLAFKYHVPNKHIFIHNCV